MRVTDCDVVTTYRVVVEMESGSERRLLASFQHYLAVNAPEYMHYKEDSHGIKLIFEVMQTPGEIDTRGNAWRAVDELMKCFLELNA
jgi:hypothetical protein